MFYFDSETISGAGGLCFETKKLKKVVNFFQEKSAPTEIILAMPQTPGDLAWEFPDLEMTWFLYCTGAAIGSDTTEFLAKYSHTVNDFFHSFQANEQQLLSTKVEWKHEWIYQTVTTYIKGSQQNRTEITEPQKWGKKLNVI